MAALMVLRAHLLADLVPGAYYTGEQTLAQELWKRLPDQCVIVVDKGFINYAVFSGIQSQGSQRHWLCRAKANLKWQVIRALGPGDDLGQIPINRSLRKQHPDLPEVLPARVIRYHRRGFRPQVLLTSLLDPDAYPAREIVALYHERWELELGFDEVKTHTLERTETLRSKAPQRVHRAVDIRLPFADLSAAQRPHATTSALPTLLLTLLLTLDCPFVCAVYRSV